jgi:hypothetical protein
LAALGDGEPAGGRSTFELVWTAWWLLLTVAMLAATAAVAWL